VPGTADGTVQYLGVRESTNRIRLVTDVLLGIGVVATTTGLLSVVLAPVIEGVAVPAP